DQRKELAEARSQSDRAAAGKVALCISLIPTPARTPPAAIPADTTVLGSLVLSECSARTPRAAAIVPADITVLWSLALPECRIQTADTRTHRSAFTSFWPSARSATTSGQRKMSARATALLTGCRGFRPVGPARSARKPTWAR